MRASSLLILVAVAACSAPPPIDKPREVCGNGKDDDSNGFTDCQDPDCSGQAGCPVAMTDGGGNFGSCARCGSICTKQADCLTVDYQTDTPLAECVGGKCQRLNTNVQVTVELDTASLAGSFSPLRSLNTRFVSKRAVDGAAATCLTVRDAAMGKTAADSAQIEKSNKFNLRGYDVRKVMANPGTIVTQYFVNVGTGTEFLIWTEVWAGPVDTATKLPSGNRISWGCFEDGAAIADVVPSDDCSSVPDGGVCRTIKVKLKNGPE